MLRIANLSVPLDYTDESLRLLVARKLKTDPAFHLDDAALAEILDVKQFIGCAPSQTRAFVEEAVRPVLEACGAGDGTDEVRV